MSSEIVIALIGVFSSIVTCVISNSIANKNFTNLISYRIEQLEKKQDIHNSVIERVYKLEKQAALQDQTLQEIKDKLGA